MNDEELTLKFSRYVENDMGEDERRLFDAELASDAQINAAFHDFQRTQSMIAVAPRASAPVGFGNDVQKTIHQRSGGRFFGRKAFGDRVPFELLTFIILALALGLALFLRGNDLGALL